MPKKVEPIEDALLLSNGVWDLNQLLPISDRQVWLMTGLSKDTLKDRRLAKPPKPPLRMKPGDPDKVGEAVWYPLGEVLLYMKGKLVRELPTIKRPVGISTFSEFLAKGRADDEWLFSRSITGQLVDFFAGLRMSDLVDHETDDDGWLTLTAYLDDTADWTAAQRAKLSHRALGDTTEQPVEVPSCAKCGKPDTPNHPCRF